MAEFVCKVGDPSGRILQQVETAQSEGEARQKLAERGFYVFSVRANLDILAQFTKRRAIAAIRPDDFLIFNQQFNTLVKAGLPILKALDLLAERAAAPACGRSLATSASAFAKAPCCPKRSRPRDRFRRFTSR